MSVDQGPYWSRYLANAQVDVTFAAYTKVPPSWALSNEAPGFNRMYYFFEGDGYIRLDGEDYRPRPGELYILPAGRLTSFGTDNADTYGKHWCHFTAKVVGDLHLFDVVKAPVRVTPRDPDAVTRHFESLSRHTQSDSLTAGFHIRAALLELLALFLESADDVRLHAKTTSTFGKMNAVLDHIERRIAEPITVEELARLAHFQPNYFIQVFKNFTGFSPIQYINRVRLDKAGQLLAFTGLSVSAVAEEVGMEFSYFSRMFKDYTGSTPTAYREMMTGTPPAPRQSKRPEAST